MRDGFRENKIDGHKLSQVSTQELKGYFRKNPKVKMGAKGALAKKLEELRVKGIGGDFFALKAAEARQREKDAADAAAADGDDAATEVRARTRARERERVAERGRQQQQGAAREGRALRLRALRAARPREGPARRGDETGRARVSRGEGTGRERRLSGSRSSSRVRALGTARSNRRGREEERRGREEERQSRGGSSARSSFRSRSADVCVRACVRVWVRNGAPALYPRPPPPALGRSSYLSLAPARRVRRSCRSPVVTWSSLHSLVVARRPALSRRPKPVAPHPTRSEAPSREEEEVWGVAQRDGRRASRRARRRVGGGGCGGAIECRSELYRKFSRRRAPLRRRADRRGARREEGVRGVRTTGGRSSERDGGASACA